VVWAKLDLFMPFDDPFPLPALVTDVCDVVDDALFASTVPLLNTKLPEN
jgi:hypothetical protein